MGSWRKSTYSDGNGGECVELAVDAAAVLVRDTKDHGTGAVLRVAREDWKRFTQGIKDW